MAQELFEFEGAYDRTRLVGLFREFAAALEEDRPATVGDEEVVSIEFPPRVSVALEGERAGDEPATITLGIDLEWDEPPERSSVDVETGSPRDTGGDDDEDGAIASEEDGPPDEPERDDRSPDPAAATMPPDAIARDPDRSSDDPDEDGTGTGTRRRRSRFEVYRDRADEWRWRLVHPNGNIIADGGEGYASRYNATRAVRGVMRNAPDATIEQR